MPVRDFPSAAIFIWGFVFQHFFDKIGYYKAQSITELLYPAGLITFDEYDKLTEMSSRTFSPMYADLLPKTLDKSSNQR